MHSLPLAAGGVEGVVALTAAAALVVRALLLVAGLAADLPSLRTPAVDAAAADAALPVFPFLNCTLRTKRP